MRKKIMLWFLNFCTKYIVIIWTISSIPTSSLLLSKCIFLYFQDFQTGEIFRTCDFESWGYILATPSRTIRNPRQEKLNRSEFLPYYLCPGHPLPLCLQFFLNIYLSHSLVSDLTMWNWFTKAGEWKSAIEIWEALPIKHWLDMPLSIWKYNEDL